MINWRQIHPKVLRGESPNVYKGLLQHVIWLSDNPLWQRFNWSSQLTNSVFKKCRGQKTKQKQLSVIWNIYRSHRSNNVLTSAVCSRHQYVLTNDHSRQDSIIYHWLNSRALNREPGFIQSTQLIFMQAYFITLHGWHAPAANTSKYSSLSCQSDIAYVALIITKQVKEISREVKML